MLFLSSIEIDMLIVTLKSISKYELGNGAKVRERFLVSKVEFIF